MRSTIIHLVPFDGIGGVEVAARSSVNLTSNKFDFSVEFINKNIDIDESKLELFNPISLFGAALRIRRMSPDFLIVSLWRSYLVGLIVKFIAPKIKLVVFLHCSRDKHWVDHILTKTAAYFAHAVWADSKATLLERVPNLHHQRQRIISFVTRRLEALPRKTIKANFIFWGRLTHQKNVEYSLSIFAKVKKDIPDARFWIIGPDCGALNSLTQLKKELNVEDSVIFLGPMDQDKIFDVAQQASFYLQTSSYEGMGMSVVEAMQLGLVPIVTAVGQIANYCQDGVNSIIITNPDQTITQVKATISSEITYQKMRSAALETWKIQPLYVDSLRDACDELLNSDK